MVLRPERRDGRGTLNARARHFRPIGLTARTRQIGKVTNILVEMYELWPTITPQEMRPITAKLRQRYAGPLVVAPQGVQAAPGHPQPYPAAAAAAAAQHHHHHAHHAAHHMPGQQPQPQIAPVYPAAHHPQMH